MSAERAKRGFDIIEPSPLTKLAYSLITSERTKQEAKWGTQRHGMTVWNTVLMEEVGEVCQEILKLRALPLPASDHPADASNERYERIVAIRRLETELIQMCAVGVAWLEHLIEVRSRVGILPDERWEDEVD